MTMLFISDLHLSCSQTHLLDLWQRFSSQYCHDISALYILGDFFEMWIGDDERAPWIDSIVTTFDSIHKKGIPVYFMHGNRDFLIGTHFAARAHWQLLPDPSCIRLTNGDNILLTHGDVLCTDDINYQRYRRIVHQRSLQKLFLMLPFKLRYQVGKKLRNQSNQTTHKPDYYFDINQEASKTLLNQHHAQQMIHGHTHQPGIHLHWHQKNYQTRYVLSDWHTQGNFLKCNQQGNFELVYFS